jgi:hypothetical protein
MNHRLRLTAPGVSTLVWALLSGCGEYSDSGPEVAQTGVSPTTPGSSSAPAEPAAPTAAPTQPAAPTDTAPPATPSTPATTSTPEPTGSAPSGSAPSGGPPPEASCENVVPCGGDVVGTWAVASSCLPVMGDTDMAGFGLGCTVAPTTGELAVTGTWVLNADGTISDETTTTGEQEINLPASCLNVSGTVTTCDRVSAPLQALGFDSVMCTDNAEAGCTCPAAVVDQMGGAAYISLSPLKKASYEVADNTITVTNRRVTTLYSYCVEGTTLTLTPTGVSKTGPIAGTIVLQKQ